MCPAKSPGSSQEGATGSRESDVQGPTSNTAWCGTTTKTSGVGRDKGTFLSSPSGDPRPGAALRPSSALPLEKYSFKAGSKIGLSRVSMDFVFQKYMGNNKLLKELLFC